MQRKDTVKRRDRFAAALKDARFRKRVVRSAKLYSRKAAAATKDEDEL